MNNVIINVNIGSPSKGDLTHNKPVKKNRFLFFDKSQSFTTTLHILIKALIYLVFVLATLGLLLSVFSPYVNQYHHIVLLGY